MSVSLVSGRKDLNDHIERLEREKVKGEAEINHTADNVLSRIRQALAWTIVPSRAPDYSNELDIANAALRQLDAEIAGKEAVLEALRPRVAAVARQLPAPRNLAFDLSPQNLGVEHDVNRSTAEVAEDRDRDGAIEPRIASHA